MNDLPENWIETTLGEVALWGSGGTPNRNISEYYGGKIPWFKTGELNEGIVTEAEEYLTDDGLKNSSAKIFPKGSIMIAMYGATIGKCAILGVDGSTNQACAVAQPRKEVEPLYLFHYLRSQKQNIIDKGKGGAQPNISQTVIKEHPIPLPPLPEQKRIVAKLDNLFAHHEELKARLQNIPTLLKQFRQAVLTQAVTGKLTDEWREDKNLSEIIICKIRKEGKILITDRVGEYDLVELPNYWNWKMISEVADVKGGKRLPKGETLVSYNTGFPYLKAGDLKGGTVMIDQLEYLLPKTQEKIKRYIVSKGDVYITNVGACIGDAGIIPDEMDNANLTENALKLCNHEGVYNRYLSFWLRSPIAQGFIKKTILSGAQGKLALGRVESFPIPLPPFEEQVEIVRRVESVFTVADQIEASYKKLEEKIDHLPQAILSKAFKGELVRIEEM
jgi:type I restriction enzyme S subunit